MISKPYLILSTLLLMISPTWVRPTTGLASPESVVSGKGRYFVSNIGGKLNAEKDGDGFISELSANGRLKIAHFLPIGNDRLNAPKGMSIVGDVLYVADIDRVVGFSLSSRRQIVEHPVPGKVTFLNDLVSVDDHTLLLSDTFGNRVLTLDVATGQLAEIGVNVPGAN